jgi:aminobenzoyl-glutamate utilization protein A
MDDDRFDRLVSLRRDLHRHPEPAWCEFYTTARILDELDRIGIDRQYVGPALYAPEDRLAVPDEDELEEWYERAREAGADPDVLEQIRGGNTGILAVLEKGPGPTVGLRVDVDGLPREESTASGHVPADEGFRSETGAMHACGHDAHAVFGIGVLEAVSESDFQGTLKVLFQPAEEVVGGAKPVAESGHLDDVDAFLAVHVGLDHPTGEIVAGITDFLAVSQFEANFTGEPAHAGGHPAQGRNAVQAMAAAVQNLYAIPRNEAGATRINAGVVEGGTATNIVPEHATIEGEVRGETTDLMEYVRERADDVLEHAAGMHQCEVSVETTGEAPSAENDDELVDQAYDVAGEIPSVTSRLRTDPLGGSEDATYLMRRVQEQGGNAAYVAVGTDHPGGHHTATFDVDEESIAIGVDWLSAVVEELGAKAAN